jgi:hypothetical protein
MKPGLKEKYSTWWTFFKAQLKERVNKWKEIQEFAKLEYTNDPV